MNEVPDTATAAPQSNRDPHADLRRDERASTKARKSRGGLFYEAGMINERLPDQQL